MNFKEVLLRWFIDFFDKKSSSVVKNDSISNQEMAEDLHKPIVKKFENDKCTHLLYTMIGVLILQICN